MNKTVLSLLKDGIDKLAKLAVFHTADCLIVLSSIAWLASSAAQVVGIYRNPNYTKEEKSFMIPQEFADATVNIGTYLLVTLSLKKLATKMVQTGKFAPKSIVNFLESKGLGGKRGNLDFSLTTVEDFTNHIDTFNSFKTTVESGAAVAGGILSSNIITPIIRNRIAASRKKHVKRQLDVYDVITGKSPSMTENIPKRRYTFDDFKTKSISAPETSTYNTRYTFDDFRRKAMSV